MLLALDAGNSNITIGAFEGRDLVCQWRLRTVHDQTADEWGILLHNLFSPAGLDIARLETTHASNYAAGKRVTVAQPGGGMTGTIPGLDPAGFLIVRKDDGTNTLILAGGVRASGS